MKISVITPCFNEEKSVEACALEVARVFDEHMPGVELEHIFCDNASTDDTVTILRQLAAKDSRVKLIVNARNIGPFRNMANGLKFATGDFVVPMVPADLQDPPAAIPSMFQLLSDNVDVVYGIRKNRKEGFTIKHARNIYYRIVTAGSRNSSPPPHAGEFLIARRSVINNVINALGSYPYIRGLIAQTTDRFLTLEYDWGKRKNGKSRNSLPDLIDQALNGLVSTAKTPIRWALLTGILASLIGVGTGFVNFLIFLFSDLQTTPGIPTLIVGMFLLGGFQLLFIGLIGEYVTSIHSEVRPSPETLIVETINL